jgi:hypothetical protein
MATVPGSGGAGDSAAGQMRETENTVSARITAAESFRVWVMRASRWPELGEHDPLVIL